VCSEKNNEVALTTQSLTSSPSHTLVKLEPTLSRGTSQASIRHEKLKEMRTAFFSSHSISDGSGEPPKNEYIVSEGTAVKDNTQSDSSTRFVYSFIQKSSVDSLD